MSSVLKHICFCVTYLKLPPGAFFTISWTNLARRAELLNIRRSETMNQRTVAAQAVTSESWLSGLRILNSVT